MAKSNKMARVRYDDGKESGTEQYIIEIWDKDTGSWGFDRASRFVADAKHPEAGADFVHYSLITELVKLANLGYSLEV